MAELSFGQWIKRRRKTFDLTQMDLAHCVGCSLSAIRKIENDIRRPSRQIAQLLAGCLGVPPEEWETFLKTARWEADPDTPDDDEPDHAALRGNINLPFPSTPLVGREEELAQ